jgi:hypothetical protein
MKPRTFNQNLTWLRICISLFLLAIISLFLFSFTVSRKLGDDVWKQLGLTQVQGTEKIKNSFLDNYFETYGLKNAKNLAAGNKVAIAKDLLAYAKKYINSPTFKSDYEKARAQAKPQPYTSVRHTKDQLRQWEVEKVEKNIKRTQEVLKTSEGEMKKTMQMVLDSHNKNLKDLKDPNSKTIEMMYQDEARREEDDKKRYQENLKNWEKNYPADHKEIIRSRLKKYLDIATTVDFDAQLTEKYKKKVFVDQKYEYKPDDWKKIFRAGKEVYDVTRPFAEQWLKELQ